MDRPQHGSVRHRHRAAREGPARDVVPGHRRAEGRRRRAVDHALVPGAAGVSDVACSAPTVTRPAAASCRRCRCRAGCGPAARSSSSNPCASAMKSTRTSRISDVTMKTGSTGALCFVSVEHTDHDAARRRDPRAAGHRLPRHGRRGPGRVSQGASAAARRKASRNPCQRSRAAVSLLGADLQRPPHPLRPRLRHQGRGLSGPDLPRPAAGGADRRVRRKTSRRHRRRRNSAIAACSRCSKAASSRSTPTRPAPAWNCGSRTPRASRP